MTSPENYTDRPCTGSRREFLWEMGGGFAGLALASLLERDGFFEKHALAASPARREDTPLAPLPPAGDNRYYAPARATDRSIRPPSTCCPAAPRHRI